MPLEDALLRNSLSKPNPGIRKRRVFLPISENFFRKVLDE